MASSTAEINTEVVPILGPENIHLRRSHPESGQPPVIKLYDTGREEGSEYYVGQMLVALTEDGARMLGKMLLEFVEQGEALYSKYGKDVLKEE